jgi:hypothetical protein
MRAERLFRLVHRLPTAYVTVHCREMSERVAHEVTISNRPQLVARCSLAAQSLQSTSEALHSCHVIRFCLGLRQSSGKLKRVGKPEVLDNKKSNLGRDNLTAPEAVSC